VRARVFHRLVDCMAGRARRVVFCYYYYYYTLLLYVCMYHVCCNMEA
jgi:hypothetical protein